MDVLLFVIIIVAITSVAGLYREKIKQQAKYDVAQTAAAAEQRFAELEARIETLERIVTDQKSQLRDEIDAL